MAFLILEIETMPRPSIDEAVEEAVSNKVKSYIERIGDDPKKLNHSFVQPHPFSVRCYVLVCAGSRMMEVQKKK